MSGRRGAVEVSEIICYQDESGDLYCLEHADELTRSLGLSYTADDLAQWGVQWELRCDFCGCTLREALR